MSSWPRAASGHGRRRRDDRLAPDDAGALALTFVERVAPAARLDPPDGALALTFAQHVAPVKKQGPLVPIGVGYYTGGEGGWMVG